MSYKIVVTIPEGAADLLRQVIGEAGGGRVGKYTFCSFSVKGIGRSLPNEGANPTIGTVGQIEEIPEERIEVNCSDDQVQELVALIRTNHPYDEPAIDVYKLEDF